MAGLVPAIHVFEFLSAAKVVDARHKAGHDEQEDPGFCARYCTPPGCRTAA
jgi:hypothetical protein